MIARPRQIAMYLCKDLTNHSLQDIGVAFAGRNHTTVLHAYKTIQRLLSINIDISEDISNLLRILSS